jgi:hypothetical protein
MYVRSMASTDAPGDPSTPRDVALVERMIELDREQARLEAELAASICEFMDLRRSEPVPATAGAGKAKVLAGEFAADEIAAALGWSTHRVHDLARRCRRLRSDLPHSWGLWREGRIDGYKAGKIVQAADRLTHPESLATLDDEAADRAAYQTPTQLGRWLHRRVARLEPDQAERRHRRAMADRKVCTAMEPDGMGSLWMLAGAADISAIDANLTRLARGLGADDPRSMDQRRSDLAADLLSGRATDLDAESAASPAVAIIVPIQSLMGVDDTPGELADRSASIPASLAREIAARPGTLFYRLLTDPRGNLLDVAQLGRFPSPLLRFAVDVRDGTCTWSTCTTSAAKCDCDHSRPHPDGPTAAANLGDECRRHHRANTHAGFSVEQPEPGVFVWATPTGHRYLVEPEPLPVGRWPAPSLADDHTPVADLIHLVDVDATGPPLWEATVADALGPAVGRASSSRPGRSRPSRRGLRPDPAPTPAVRPVISRIRGYRGLRKSH